MNDPSQLLRVLGSGVRPVSPAAPFRPAPNATGGLGSGGVEPASFDQLLTAARTRPGTEVSSGRDITVDDEAGLSLTPELADRLSIAADRAEAAGMRTALVLLDEGAYTLDIPTRTITARAEGDKGLHTSIDGAVDLRSSADAAEAAAVLSTGALSLGNASLLDVLNQATDKK